MPRVSVITSVHNGELYLEKCIESILNQTFQDFEYIILNNGSTDHTHEILKKYTDPRLRIIHQEDLGLSRSLNKGVDLSNSDLIARLDVDDYSVPQRLDRQVTFMKQNPKVVLCGSRFQELLDEESFTQRVRFIETDEAIRKALCLFNPFAHSTVIFRKKIFPRAGGYNCQLKYGQDYDLWLRMLGFGEAVILKEELVIVTISKESESNRNSRKSKLEGLRIRWDAFRKFGGNPREALYYFLKSLTGLISPSESHLTRPPKSSPNVKLRFL